MRAVVRIITVLLKMFLDNSKAPCTKNVTLCTQTLKKIKIKKQILVWTSLIHWGTDILVLELCFRV